MDIEFRNPVRQPDGAIECEINHADFGWQKYSACETDSAEFGRDLYAQIIASGVAIVEKPEQPSPHHRWDDARAEWVEHRPAATKARVNAEAARRIWQVLQVDNHDAAMVTQQNYTNWMISAQITLDGGGTLSASDQAKRQRIIDGYALIEAIRAASNTLTALDPIPADYADDVHWPEEA